MKKIILLFSILVLFILPLTSARIIVQTTGSTASTYDTHTFKVNKYYFQQPKIQVIEPKTTHTMYIEPIESEKIIDTCEAAEFSFKLINPSTREQVYRLEALNFKGIVYLTPQIILPAEESRILVVKFEPECGSLGIMNPKIKVETESEEAILPLLLYVNAVEIEVEPDEEVEPPLEVLDESDCTFYYNESICNSQKYVRINQLGTYEIDLSGLFFDPDSDELTLGSNARYIKVKFKNEKATLNPRWDFYGKEELVFKAEDGKGGVAYSPAFYVHVIPNGKSYLENFFIANFMYLLFGALIVIIIFTLLILAVFRPAKDKDDENNDGKDKK